MDGTLKLWDLRKFKTPMSVFDDLPTNYATTNCCFSPDERLLLTGTAASSSSAAGQQQQGGAGVFVDTKELKVVRRMGMPTHVAAVRWHHRLNQIFVGTGKHFACLLTGRACLASIVTTVTLCNTPAAGICTGVTVSRW